MSREDGSAGAQVLAVIFFLAALLASLVLVAGASASYVRRSEAGAAEGEALEALASRALAALADDASPSADSLFDAGRGRIARIAEETGSSIVVEDLSSGLALNFLDAGFVERGFQDLLGRDYALGDLERRRSETGLSLDPRDFGGVVAEDREGVFALYGWANPNVAEESALRRLAVERGVAEGVVDGLARAAREARAAGRALPVPAVRELLGSDAERLEPFIAAVPAVNANLADRRLLEALLRHPDFGLEGSRAKADALLGARAAMELDEDALARTLGVPPGHSLYQHLGVRTWFWRISAARNGRRAVIVAARAPRDKGGCRVIERRLEPCGN